MKIRIPNHQKAFSLLELLLVLAIVAALTIGTFVVYPKLRDANTAKHETEIIVMAVSSVRATFPRRNYTNLSTAVARNGNFFPDSMNGSGNSLQNRFGGAITIAPTIRSPTLFRIGYRRVPSNVCVRMLPLLAQHFKGVSVVGQDGQTYIVRDEFRQFVSTSNVAPRALNETNIAQGCKSSTGYAGEILIFDQ